jgi:hypothetical protein
MSLDHVSSREKRAFPRKEAIARKPVLVADTASLGGAGGLLI